MLETVEKSLDTKDDKVFYRVGNHLSVLIHPALRGKILPGGECVRRGDLIARLDLTLNLPSHQDLRGYQEQKALILAFISDLIALIDAIKEGKIPDRVIYFSGISHLGGMQLMQEFGFTVTDTDPYLRSVSALLGCWFARDFSFNNIHKKWKRTKKISFSRSELLANEEHIRAVLTRFQK